MKQFDDITKIPVEKSVSWKPAEALILIETSSTLVLCPSDHKESD